MVNPGYISKEVVAEAVVNSINEMQTNAEIRTLYLDGYKKPDKILHEGENKKGYIPDVEYRFNGRVELYVIELDTNIELNKWTLFSHYTDKENWNFNIVTQKDNLAHFRELLKSHNISAKLIYF